MRPRQYNQLSSVLRPCYVIEIIVIEMCLCFHNSHASLTNLLANIYFLGKVCAVRRWNNNIYYLQNAYPAYKGGLKSLIHMKTLKYVLINKHQMWFTDSFITFKIITTHSVIPPFHTHTQGSGNRSTLMARCHIQRDVRRS